MEEKFLNTEEIKQVIPAAIAFPYFKQYEEEAKRVAEYINSFEFSEENVKIAKQTVADARKLTKALNDRRIRIKKEVLEPYDAFEKQVKHITGIIEAAENDLREKIRLSEDKERELKEDQVRNIFSRRVKMYSIARLIPDAVEFFLEPRHLNKTTSIKSVEDEMVEWLESVQSDVDAIKALPNADDILVEYACTLNMAQAIQTVAKRNEIADRFEETVKDTPAEEVAYFKIVGTANIRFAEKLLHENGIGYTLKK